METCRRICPHFFEAPHDCSAVPPDLLISGTDGDQPREARAPPLSRHPRDAHQGRERTNLCGCDVFGSKQDQNTLERGWTQWSEFSRHFCSFPSSMTCVSLGQTPIFGACDEEKQPKRALFVLLDAECRQVKHGQQPFLKKVGRENVPFGADKCGHLPISWFCSR